MATTTNTATVAALLCALLLTACGSAPEESSSDAGPEVQTSATAVEDAPTGPEGDSTDDPATLVVLPDAADGPHLPNDTPRVIDTTGVVVADTTATITPDGLAVTSGNDSTVAQIDGLSDDTQILDIEGPRPTGERGWAVAPGPTLVLLSASPPDGSGFGSTDATTGTVLHAIDTDGQTLWSADVPAGAERILHYDRENGIAAVNDGSLDLAAGTVVDVLTGEAFPLSGAGEHDLETLVRGDDGNLRVVRYGDGADQRGVIVDATAGTETDPLSISGLFGVDPIGDRVYDIAAGTESVLDEDIELLELGGLSDHYVLVNRDGAIGYIEMATGADATDLIVPYVREDGQRLDQGSDEQLAFGRPGLFVYRTQQPGSTQWRIVTDAGEVDYSVTGDNAESAELVDVGEDDRLLLVNGSTTTLLDLMDEAEVWTVDVRAPRLTRYGLVGDNVLATELPDSDRHVYTVAQDG